MQTEVEKSDRINENQRELLSEFESRKREEIERYITLLLEYNQKVNLVSRRITRAGLSQLIAETHLLDRYISTDFVIDAGSGSGLLGIPIAILNPHKRVVLVESMAKKAAFLKKIVENMELVNVRVCCSRIEEYMENSKENDSSLVARGFPGIKTLFDFFNRGLINEAVIITSENKIKKNRIDMENVNQKTYNVPLRNHLKILKLENVSRET